MNRHHPIVCLCRRTRPSITALLLIVLGFTGIVLAQPQTTTNWLSLQELLKKWEKTPLTDVERAATNGDLSAQHYLGYCYVEGFRTAQDPKAGMIWYQRALQGGYLPSANNIGRIYQRGLLGSNDLGKAIYYYTYAADRGVAQAQFNLGVLNRDGIGVNQNAVEAMRWFQRAAKQGHSGAMIEIGRLYRFGQGVPSDQPQAIQWFERAAEKNDVRAELNLGLIYEESGQDEMAFNAYQKAADQGLVEAMTYLYLCYYDGKGVATDHAKAMTWLTKAAEGKDPYAQCLMGYRCENPDWKTNNAGQMVFEPKLKEACRWYRLSAEQGWAGGQYHLGLFYLEGKVVELDEKRGLELVRAASDQQLDDATRELAGLYSRGVGEPRDEEDHPIQLLLRAKAWNDLQFRYEYGLGTPRDLVMAARCYSKIVLRGTWYYSPGALASKVEYSPPRGDEIGWHVIAAPDEQAQIIGPPRREHNPSDDVLRALSLYLKSATGDGQAALQIGNRYLTGQDAPKSVPLAWTWFTIAAQNGSTEARAKITRLESQMTSDDLQAGRQHLAEQVQELKEVAAAIPKNIDRQER